MVSLCGHAQVGINNTDPEGILDVVSSDQGMLMPRVALTETTVDLPVTNTSSSGPKLANGTLVYNTNTANDVFPGYYYWEDSRWVRSYSVSSDKMFNTVVLPVVNNDNADFSLTGPNDFIDIFRLDRIPTTDIFLSGIQDGTHGKAIQLYNLSNINEITMLSEANAIGSDPENRFYLDQNIVLKPGRGIILVYDGLVQRWIVFRGDN
ncbi:hypothetical protein POV27_09090 [Aureisphaera galaxeae]|uniref:hypothetical protein n=1 Tax=Aureisphaera galaxeae TaxID=1538023 RepID=UPI002350C1C6|nr:hypothetical protein [Aureisphaera galaxeae]MDC8004204.1 hypothetical protein [Aureisphaera galaxeae]